MSKKTSTKSVSSNSSGTSHQRKVVGLLAGDLTDKFEMEILKGVSKRLAQDDVSLLCFVGGALRTNQGVNHPNPMQAWRNQIYNLVSPNNVDGLLILSDIICAYLDSQERLAFHRRFDPLPLVTIGSFTELGYPSVISDDKSGIRNLMDHLVSAHNCRNIAFLGNMEEIGYYHGRFLEYRDSLERKGLPINDQWVYRGGFSREEIVSSMEDLVRHASSIEAILCADDYMASHALHFLTDRGYSIPQDFILTGFDDVPESQYLSPALTTVQQPLQHMGYTGAELLLNYMHHKEKPDSRVLASEIIIRRSCGCFYNTKGTITRSSISSGQVESLRSIARNLLRPIPIFSKLSHELNSWIDLLLLPFNGGCTENSIGQFYEAISKICRDMQKKKIEPLLLKKVVSPLLTLLSECYPQKSDLFFYDRIRGNAMELIEEFTMGKLVKEIYSKDIQALNLHYLSQRLITACQDFTMMQDIISEEFPKLKIKKFYLSLYLVKRREDRAALNLSFPRQTVRSFSSDKLIPGGIKELDCRGEYVILPLIYQGEALGFMLIEDMNYDGLLYENLSSLFSNIIKEGELIHLVRNHTIMLKHKVQKRTKAIKIANDLLKREVDKKEKISQELNREKELAQTTLKSIGDGVIITDLLNRITYMNPVVEKFLKIRRDSSPLKLEDLIDLRGYAFMDLLDEPVELKISSINGETVHISLLAAAITGEDRVTRGRIYIARDISKRKKAEKEAEQRLEQLIHAGKMASMGILVSGVAHEINNPNNFIMMNAPILQDIFKDLEPELKKLPLDGELLGGLDAELALEQIPLLLDGVSSGSKRINGIVRELKDYAQPNPFGMESQVDLNEIIRSTVNLLSALISQSTQSFTMELTEGLPGFYGNRQKIEQVLVNLLSNACQALESTEDSISIRSFRQRSFVCFEIEDSGSGMARETLEHVTDPFFTTKREQGGMGLGLSISDKIIQNHGGSLSFDSTEGLGTRALLLLPINNPGEVS